MQTSYKEYIVKSTEEECGEEYFKIKVPECMSEEALCRAIEMARKYASPCFDFDENPADYDGYFEKMLDVKEQTNGQDMFFMYLDFFGIASEYLNPDFEFEW